jgi:hypothetical protein
MNVVKVSMLHLSKNTPAGGILAGTKHRKTN